MVPPKGRGTPWFIPETAKQYFWRTFAMRHALMTRLFPSLLVAWALLLGGALPAALAAQSPVVKAEWAFPKQVSYKDVAPLVSIPKPPKVMLIDSRPYEGRFVHGYIPTAVSLPDSAFDKKAKDVLPADKSTRLIFYCQGPECVLSHQSAFKAQKLGYTDVAVYAGGLPDWQANGGVPSVGVEHIMQLMDKNEPYILVDSRPAKKFAEGSIPTAISIPDSQFDKRKGMLPADKKMKVIFFCGGYECVLSHDSAMKAKKLGYVNTVECEAGYPAWKKLYGDGAALAKKDAGKVEEGVFSVIDLENALKGGKPPLTLVDVRSAAEYKAGTLPTAIHITVDELEAKLASLPKDKPVVFFCSTGARAGEAYYMAKDKDPKATHFYYLEAAVTAKDGKYSISPNTK